jgi:hypothetical protein
MTEKHTPVQQQMLTFTCDYCHAPSGSWCVTKSGNRASYLHGARWWAWKNTQTEQHLQQGKKTDD